MMKMTGYFITHKTKDGLRKIEERIINVGIDYYKRHELFPVYCATYNGNEGVFIHTNREINVMELLAFSFSGLVEDEEKIDEIERFGKYRCIIDYVCEDDITIIKELIS